MKAVLAFLLLLLSAALPARAAQNSDTDRLVRAGDAAELALLRWRHPVDPRGDVVEAEQLLLERPSGRLARTSFDLLTIRRDWADERRAAGGWDWRR